MTISKSAVQKVLDTLPIGYYLGISNKVDVQLDENAATSYADLLNKKIVIAYNNVKTIRDDCNLSLEQIVRTLLYHELSHIILTPDRLLHALNKKQQKIVNAFEDERIERIMQDYYINVDFKKFVFAINNVDATNIPKPKSPFEEYYQLVRFGYGTKEKIDAFLQLMRNWENITSLWAGGEFYPKEILRFYKKYFENVENDQSPEETENNQSSVEKESNQSSMEKEKQSDSGEEKSFVQSNIFVGFGQRSLTQNKFSLEQSFSTFSKDNSYLPKLENIFHKAFKKQAQRSGSLNAYSGKINPRDTSRSDYKWFIRPDANGSQKRFDKVHLSMIVDDSSSFAKSREAINNMLSALAQLERNHPEFSFDLIKIGTYSQIAPKNERSVKCASGSIVSKTLFKHYNQTQKANCTNINLCVMDGEFIVDDYAFKAFNHPNVTVISDPENEIKLNAQAPLARKIYIDGNYAERLISEVFSALERLIA